MTIKARQHIPPFVETDQRHSVEVDSLEALLAVPWIAQWAVNTPEHDEPHHVIAWPNGVATETVETWHVPAKTFHQWSLADGHLLMAEYQRGDEFWVVAFIDSDEPLALPAWVETETARRRRERWNRGEM